MPDATVSSILRKNCVSDSYIPVVSQKAAPQAKRKVKLRCLLEERKLYCRQIGVSPHVDAFVWPNRLFKVQTMTF